MEISKKKRAEIKESKVMKRLKAYLNIAKANDADNRKRKHEDTDDEDAINQDVSHSHKPKKFIDDNEIYSPKVQITNGDELRKIKLEVRERVQAKMQSPKIYLTNAGLEAQLHTLSESRLQPLYASDIQHLVLNSVLGTYASFFPRWCKLLRVGKISHTVLLLVDNEGIEEFNHDGFFRRAKKLFDLKLEIHSPGNYDSSLAMELLWTPRTTNELSKGTIQQTDTSHINGKMKNIFEPKKDDSKRKRPDKFPRTQLLLSADQMILENYPLAIYTGKYEDFIFTKAEYDPVTNKSPMFAVDCEMVMTTGSKMELARIAVVDEDLDIVYHTFVKPKNPVTNYLTQYSGITAKLLEEVTTTLEDVQLMICKYLPNDAILIGQSLNSDLNAMKMMHPYVIDTSIIFNLSGFRQRKTGLRALCKIFLNSDIQLSVDGHCPIEDSRAAMQLVLLKLSNDIKFGDVILESYMPGLKQDCKICSIFTRFLDKDKQVALITSNELMSAYKQDVNIASTTKNSKLHVTVENEWATILETTRHTCMENQLTISHIELRPNLHEFDPEAHAKDLKQLDRKIKKIYKSMAKNSLFIIVLGGSLYPGGIQNGKMYSNAVNAVIRAIDLTCKNILYKRS